MCLFCLPISVYCSGVFLQDGYDVFNALDLMENDGILANLKFGIGDGNLQYYLYNWKCPEIQANKVFSCLCFEVFHD